MYCLRRFTVSTITTVNKLREVAVNNLTRCNCTKWTEHRMLSTSFRALPFGTTGHVLSAKTVLTEHPLGVLLIDVRNYQKVPQKKKKGKPKVNLSKDEMEQLINVDELQGALTDVIEDLKQDYLKNLSVRTSSGAVESLVVQHEDSEFRLNEVVRIQRKGSHLIVINATTFPEVIPSILKALEESGMNLNPQQAANTLYLTIPMVTREHREKLAKTSKAMFVKAKDAFRDVQNSFIKLAQSHKGHQSDDLIFDTQNQIISITDEFIAKAEKMMKSKQEELLGTK